MGFGSNTGVSAAVENVGFGRNHFLQFCIGGGVFIGSAAQLMIISSIGNAINKDLNLPEIARGMAVSVVFLGAFFGSFISGYLGDNYGRRISVLIAYLGLIVWTFFSLTAIGFWSLIFYRFFVGVSFGLCVPAMNSLFGEISPVESRPLALGLSMLLFGVGSFYGTVLLYVNDPSLENLNWRMLNVYATIPLIIFGGLSYFMLIESPHYLALIGDRKRAHEVLSYLAGDDAEDVLSGFDSSNERTWVVSPEQESLSWEKSVPKLFGTWNYLYTTVTLCIACFVGNFVSYGLMYTLPNVLPQLHLPLTAAGNLCIAAFLGTVGSVVGFLLCLLLDRKTVIIIYFLLEIAGVFTFAITTTTILLSQKAIGQTGVQDVALTGIYFSKIAAGVGGVVVYLYVLEVFPTIVRVTGSALCMGLGRIGSICTPTVYDFMFVATGSHAAYLLLMYTCFTTNISAPNKYFLKMFVLLLKRVALCVVNMVMVYYLPFETRNVKLAATFEDVVKDEEEFESYGAVETKAI